MGSEEKLRIRIVEDRHRVRQSPQVPFPEQHERRVVVSSGRRVRARVGFEEGGDRRSGGGWRNNAVGEQETRH